MDDMNHKRMRHEIIDDVSRYGIGNGGGSASARQIPTGCHLDIRPATSHLFLGQPVEVEVRLLDDEDVVQPTTVGINVTVANEDNKVGLGEGFIRRCLPGVACFPFPFLRTLVRISGTDPLVLLCDSSFPTQLLRSTQSSLNSI